MRVIRLWILKMQLAAIFKKAEHLAELGVSKGDQRFVSLFDESMKLTYAYKKHYPAFDPFKEMPGLRDLQNLTVPPDVKKRNKQIGMYVALGAASGVLIGIYGGMITIGYHLITRMFGW